MRNLIYLELKKHCMCVDICSDLALNLSEDEAVNCSLLLHYILLFCLQYVGLYIFLTYS